MLVLTKVSWGFVGIMLVLLVALTSCKKESGGPTDPGTVGTEHQGGGGNSPVADFTATPTSGTAPLTVHFTDNSSNSHSSWIWDFGDGSTSTDQNPSHVYNSGGNYSVTLRVSNAIDSDTKAMPGQIGVLLQEIPPTIIVRQASQKTDGIAFEVDGQRYEIHKGQTLTVPIKTEFLFQPFDVLSLYKCIWSVDHYNCRWDKYNVYPYARYKIVDGQPDYDLELVPD